MRKTKSLSSKNVKKATKSAKSALYLRLAIDFKEDLVKLSEIELLAYNDQRKQIKQLMKIHNLGVDLKLNVDALEAEIYIAIQSMNNFLDDSFEDELKRA